MWNKYIQDIIHNALNYVKVLIAFTIPSTFYLTLPCLTLIFFRLLFMHHEFSAFIFMFHTEKPASYGPSIVYISAFLLVLFMVLMKVRRYLFSF